MPGRKPKYDSPADKQRAYRARQKGQNVTLRNCPNCDSEQLCDMTGQFPTVDLGGSMGGKTYLCQRCGKWIAVIANLPPRTFDVHVQLTRIGQYYAKQERNTDD